MWERERNIVETVIMLFDVSVIIIMCTDFHVAVIVCAFWLALIMSVCYFKRRRLCVYVFRQCWLCVCYVASDCVCMSGGGGGGVFWQWLCVFHVVLIMRVCKQWWSCVCVFMWWWLCVFHVTVSVFRWWWLCICDVSCGSDCVSRAVVIVYVCFMWQ